MSTEQPMPARSRRSATFKGNYEDLDGETSDFFDEDGDESEKFQPSGPSDDDDEEYKAAKKEPGRTTRTVKRAKRSSTRSVSKDVDDSASIPSIPPKTTSIIPSSTVADEDRDGISLARRVIDEFKDKQADSSMAPDIKLLSAPRDDRESDTLFLDGFEGYFDQHKSREKISTTPFSKAPKLTLNQFSEFVRIEDERLHEERDYLSSLYRTMFPQWYFELTQGFSLLFYGVGSKRSLIMDFVSEVVAHRMPVIACNGYHPAATFKEILNASIPFLITNEKVRLKLPKHPSDLLAALISQMELELDETPRLTVVINNIDGEAMRSDRNQELLTRFASLSQVRLIASIDNINSPIMWDSGKLTMYNFVWHDLTTFQPYYVETSFGEILDLGKDRTIIGQKGANYVLGTLTPNHRRLYALLISKQIEVMLEKMGQNSGSKIGTATHGIEFQDLLKETQKSFLGAKDAVLRGLLKELLDHKMLATTKEASGREIIYAPFTRDALEQMLVDDVSL